MKKDLNKEIESALAGRLLGFLQAIILAVLCWTASTLIDLREDVAVLKYRVNRVYALFVTEGGEAKPHEEKPAKLACPGFPFLKSDCPNTKEKSYGKRP